MGSTSIQINIWALPGGPSANPARTVREAGVTLLPSKLPAGVMCSSDPLQGNHQWRHELSCKPQGTSVHRERERACGFQSSGAPGPARTCLLGIGRSSFELGEIVSISYVRASVCAHHQPASDGVWSGRSGAREPSRTTAPGPVGRSNDSMQQC